MSSSRQAYALPRLLRGIKAFDRIRDALSCRVHAIETSEAKPHHDINAVRRRALARPKGRIDRPTALKRAMRGYASVALLRARIAFTLGN